MVQTRMYTSLEEPPNTSLFHHAGGSTATKQKPQSAPVQAFMDAATVIASALSKPASNAVSLCPVAVQHN